MSRDPLPSRSSIPTRGVRKPRSSETQRWQRRHRRLVLEFLEDRRLLSSTDTVAPEDAVILPTPAKYNSAVAPILLTTRDAIAVQVQTWGDTQTEPRRTGLTDLSSPLVHVDEAGRMQVYVIGDAGSSEFLSLLAAAGFQAETSNADMGIVQGWISYTGLDGLRDVPGVVQVKPPSYARTRTGSVNTAGDAILLADDVRAQFAAYGIDGSGITIGVISDGVDHRANSQATGDLPGTITINPALPGSGDEGTALLEVVHDLAPGAALYFSGPSTSAEMVDSIAWLTAQGCDVIMDDLGFPGDPFFADGPVAQAAASAVASGVVYVSAAGNDAQQHYQAQYELAAGSDGYHDFGGGDIGLAVTIPDGSTFEAVLQWSDAFGASGNDYDLYLDAEEEDQTGVSVLAWSENSQDGSGDPLEYLSYENTNGSALTAYLKIRLFAGDSRELELLTWGNSSQQYATPADSIYGQAAVESVISVGAIDASDLGHDTMEFYSSHGPSTIYTDFSAQTKTLRNSLDGAGIDGVQTKVGQLGFFYNPFYGTSAAAPHIAALAALVLDTDASLTPAQVSDALASTAVDLTAYGIGYDNVSGWGRFDGLGAVYKVFTPAQTDLTDASDTGSSNTDNVTSDTTPTFTGTVPSDSYVRLYVDGVEKGTQQLSGGASTYSITSSSLTPGTYAVTIRVAPSSSTPTDDLSHASPALSITIIPESAVPPPTGLDLAAADDTGPSNTDNVTNKSSLTISGLGESGATLELFDDVNDNGEIDAGELLGTTTVAAGAFSLNVTLVAGVHRIRAIQTVAGTASDASAALIITVDTVAPTVILTVPPSPTNDTTPSVTVTATDALSGVPNGTQVRLDVDLNNDGDYADGGEASYTTAVLTGGTATFAVSPALSAGTYTFRARVTDVAGNEGTSSDSTLIVDTTTPSSSISGYKFNDLNGDGDQDANEPGLAGWTIYLDQNNNGVLDPVTRTYSSSHVPKVIGDLSTVTSKLAVNGDSGTKITDVNVTLDITHAWDSDLAVYLIGPGPTGTRVELFSSVGVDGQNFTNTTLDDAATVSITDGSAPFTGSFRPVEALSALNGLDPIGTWELEIEDQSGDETGILNSWSLTLTTDALDEPYTQTNADGSYEFTDLSPGTYMVRELQQTNWEQTWPNSLLGIAWDGQLYDVDPATGAAVNPRTTNVTTPVGLTVASDCTLYTLNTFGGKPQANSLYILDSITGQSALVGSTGLARVAEGDLDFDPVTGILYGIQEVSGGRRLFTVDPSTGQGTIVGGLAAGDVSAMVFSGDGTLYMMDTSMDRVLTINKATGATLTAIPLSVNLGGLAGMDFDPTAGTLYVTDSGTGGTNQLYSLDPASGQMTAIGPTGLTGFALSGLAFLGAGGNGAHIVILGSGEDVSGKDFGNRQLPGEILGQKWNDLDGDGIQDADELEGLEGWTIYLDLNHNGRWDGATLEPYYDVTDGDGDYAIVDVPPGTYQVREEQQSGWNQTYPASTTLCTPTTYTVQLAAGQAVTGKDFGNTQRGEIHGVKWNDENGNQTKDAGEAALQGWTIYIDANDNGQLDADERSTTTDANGNYAFTGLQSGTYRVREVLKSGWKQTRPTAGYTDVTVSPGACLADVLFGNWPAVSVAVAPASVTENGTANLVYTFTLPVAATSDVSVSFSVGGTATFDPVVSQTDYAVTGAATFAPTQGTVIITSGSTTATVTVDPQEDLLTEFDETVILTVLPGSAYAVGDPSAATGTITNVEFPRFWVVDDLTDDLFRYNASHSNLDRRSLGTGVTVPRGVAVAADGTKVWVLNYDSVVYVQDSTGRSLGSWSAPELQLPTGIATSGSDIWIVDKGTDRVYCYQNAVSWTSGEHQANSSFPLAAGNATGEGIATDGTTVWVVDGDKLDRVHVYDTSGTSLGSWSIDPANTSPTGIAMDPSGASQSMWIVDISKARVYEYADARDRRSGSQSAASYFALQSANASPHDIAVRGINSALQLKSIGAQRVAAETELSFAVSTAGESLQASTLTFAASGLPPGATFDPAAHTFRWTPEISQASGTYAVTFSVTDGVSLASEEVVIRVVDPYPWQNHANPPDADGSGRVSPLDALLIINRINLFGSGELPPRQPDDPYFDVNRDGRVGPDDTLMVVNCLNAEPEAEGEAGLTETGDEPHMPALVSIHVAAAAFLPAPAVSSGGQAGSTAVTEPGQSEAGSAGATNEFLRASDRTREDLLAVLAASRSRADWQAAADGLLAEPDWLLDLEGIGV